MPKSGVIISYDDDYKDACFYAIYQAGFPNRKKWVECIPLAPDGRKPNLATLKQWAENYGWVERADALNAELSKQLDDKVVKERAEAIKHTLEVVKDTMKMGHEYIKEHGFDTAASAVRAIGMGADMIARYAGTAELLLSVPTMSDKQLTKEMLRLLGKNENEEVIDIEAEDDEEDADSPEDDND